MNEKTIGRLLLIGSTHNDVHLRNYHSLIKDSFEEILIVTGHDIDFSNYVKLDFGLRNPLSVLRTIRELRKIIHTFKPSVIHVHQANSFGYITSIANKGMVPQVLTVWGSDVLLLPHRSILHRHIVKKSILLSDKITADAQFVKNVIEKIAGRSVDFTTANFGIDLPNMGVDISKKEKIIYSNRLHESLYNIDKIIEAFVIFHKDHPEWKLVIAGSGPLTDVLKDLAAQLPSEAYSFIGFVDSETNINNYKRSTIFTSIPSSDGTSVSLLEAMSCGAIPVLSDLPANHEWVSSMKNGVIVSDSLAHAFEQALELDTATVANMNKEIINKKATRQANRAIFIRIYTELIQPAN